MEPTTQSMLSEKDQELVAVGASIASGCVPCTTFHFRAARAAGADDREIRQAANAALEVCSTATEVMARRAGRFLDEPNSEVIANARDSQTWLINELVSISAAFAVNSATVLETHVAAARHQGATDGQILTALKVACAVKSMAGKKVQEAAVRILGGSEQDSDNCGCQDDQDILRKGDQATGAETKGRAGTRSDGCGCRKDDSQSTDG
jgi:AhpD family alkylhydroperoxidase